MIRAYVSHSICGKMGKDATEEYMKANNDKAIILGKQLKELFPSVDFYVPGDHDEFVMIAYRKGLLSIAQILEVDCVIVGKCNVLIAYAPDMFVSSGMQTEIDYAHKSGIPVRFIEGATPMGITTIHRFLEGLKT